LLIPSTTNNVIYVL